MEGIFVEVWEGAGRKNGSEEIQCQRMEVVVKAEGKFFRKI